MTPVHLWLFLTTGKSDFSNHFFLFLCVSRWPGADNLIFHTRLFQDQSEMQFTTSFKVESCVMAAHVESSWWNREGWGQPRWRASKSKVSTSYYFWRRVPEAVRLLSCKCEQHAEKKRLFQESEIKEKLIICIFLGFGLLILIPFHLIPLLERSTSKTK